MYKIVKSYTFLVVISQIKLHKLMRIFMRTGYIAPLVICVAVSAEGRFTLTEVCHLRSPNHRARPRRPIAGRRGAAGRETRTWTEATTQSMRRVLTSKRE